MKTFKEWLQNRDAELFKEVDLQRRGFLKQLGTGLGLAAAAGMAGAAPPRLTPEEKEEIKKYYSKTDLQKKLEQDSEYNPEAAKVAIKAEVVAERISYAIQTDYDKKIKDKVRRFLDETIDILAKIYKDKSGKSHEDALKELIEKYDLQSSPLVYFGTKEINPYRVLEMVKDLAYKIMFRKENKGV